MCFPQDNQAARQALEEGLPALENCSPSLQSNARPAVQRALKMVCGDKEQLDRKSRREGKPKRWPALDWQAYDDEFRISVLFYP